MQELYVDPKIPRFTRAELVAEMDRRFGGFSDGAFRKYQEKGLIADPIHDRRWTMGRPGSELGRWSDNQRHMLAAVLELRERHHTEVGGQLPLGHLANFVVWSWLHWDGYVELPQTRRALRTWATPQIGGAKGGARSRQRVSDLARQHVDSLAPPGVLLRERIRVAEALTERLWNDDLDGLRHLVGELEKVIDPDGTGRRVGAPGASADAAGELERLHLSYRAAKAVCTGHPPLSDRDWEVARVRVRQSWADYEADWARFVATAITPELFVKPTVAYQISRCATALLLTLAAAL